MDGGAVGMAPGDGASAPGALAGVSAGSIQILIFLTFFCAAFSIFERRV